MMELMRQKKDRTWYHVRYVSLMDEVCDSSDRPPAIDQNTAAYLENVSKRVVDNMVDFNLLARSKAQDSFR